jgi:hypothetical protein
VVVAAAVTVVAAIALVAVTAVALVAVAAVALVAVAAVALVAVVPLPGRPDGRRRCCRRPDGAGWTGCGRDSGQRLGTRRTSSQAGAEVCALACPDKANKAATPATESSRVRIDRVGEKGSLIISLVLSRLMVDWR